MPCPLRQATEEIIGAPVFFCDAAAIDDDGGKTGVPIIGDFRYFHINYDPDTIYDSDKNVDTGDYIWVLTAWFDAKFNYVPLSASHSFTAGSIERRHINAQPAT